MDPNFELTIKAYNKNLIELKNLVETLKSKRDIYNHDKKELLNDYEDFDKKINDLSSVYPTDKYHEIFQHNIQITDQIVQDRKVLNKRRDELMRDLESLENDITKIKSIQNDIDTKYKIIKQLVKES
jgi:chromosome segregation ATPase